MRSRMIVGGIAPVLLLLGLAGCGNPGPTSGNQAGTTGKNTGSATETTAANGSAAASVANKFLRSLQTDSIQTSLLTDDLKVLIAPPVTESDKARGHSEWALGEWLKISAERLPPGEATTFELTPDILAATVAGNDTKGPAVLRLVKSGSDWRINWFHVGPVGAETKFGTSERAEQFAFMAFLQPVMANRFELSQAMMTLSLKARIAPPLPGDNGYNRSILQSKLSQLRGNATKYTIIKQNFGTDSGTVSGNLIGPAGPTDTRPFGLKLVPGTKPGEWLIDDFEPR